MYKLSTFLAESEQGYSAVPLFGAADSVFEKTASVSLLPEVLYYINGLKPKPGSQYVLVNAMGAGEYYGSNINGDFFEESGLIHTPPNWTGKPLFDRSVGKNWTYGYPTFYNAYPYAHHRNKDPSRAYGEVELAVWNDNMKRVELVCRIDHDKCVKFGGVSVWDKIKLGQFPDVSMGSKVCYDLSSITTNWKLYNEALETFDPKKYKYPGLAVVDFHKKLKAKDGVGIRGLSITRNDYDEWTRNHMNRILPDGRKVFVYNPYPRFFDISFVFIGADRTAKTMVIIVRQGGPRYVPSAEAGEKVAAAQPTQKCLSNVLTLLDQRPELTVMTGPADKGYDTRHFWAVDKAGKVHDPTRSDYAHYAKGKPFDMKANADFISGMQQEKTAGLTDDILASAFHHKQAGLKQGEIDKEIPADKAVPLLSKTDKDLPDWALKALGAVPEEKALSTTGSMGIVLKPREFQRITLVRLGKGDLADELDEKGELFPKTDEVEPKSLGIESFMPALARLLKPLMESRSGLAPFAEKRVIIMQSGDDEPPTSLPREDLRKIGAAYNGYRQALMEHVASAQDMLPAAAPTDVEVQKLASASPDELFTPLSFGYFKNAFLDEVPFADARAGVVKVGTQSVASVKRGSPSRNTWM
jgi:hypothetical protein